MRRASGRSAPSAAEASPRATGCARRGRTCTTWRASRATPASGSCPRARSSPCTRTACSARPTTSRPSTAAAPPPTRAATPRATTRTRRSEFAPRSRRSSCRCCRPTSSWTRTRTARTWSASRRSRASARGSRRSGSRTAAPARRSICTPARSRLRCTTLLRRCPESLTPRRSGATSTCTSHTPSSLSRAARPRLSSCPTLKSLRWTSCPRTRWCSACAGKYETRPTVRSAAISTIAD